MSSSSSVRRNVGQFALGQRAVTRLALETLPQQSILDCFSRHAKGDFGDVCNDDFEANLDAIAEGLRILSTYRCDDQQGEKARVYVITEADRSRTSLLLAEEY